MTTAQPPLRADARRNVERLREAAIAVFSERGLDAPLEEIARRAEVSIGTLYNRFGSREALVDAVVPDVAQVRLQDVLARARTAGSPWDRFAGYLEGLWDLQAGDPALSDALTGAVDAPKLSAACAAAVADAQTLIDDAHADGSLRPDVGSGDLEGILHASAALVGAPLPDGAGRRTLRLLLDGLRAAAAAATDDRQPR